MKQQHLEGLVIETIERARAGYPIEDDRIEFKQAWPLKEKARQLAASANRGNGNYVIYIVGADETGAVFTVENLEVADWWAQMSAKFDILAPDLLHHIIVPIDEGNSVTALLFATDRAPYVVSTKGGSPEREVPMRSGSGTRSATRAELLRLLLPQASVPTALILAVDLEALGNGGNGGCNISGSATVFLENTTPSGSMLPLHAMTATIEAEGRGYPLRVRIAGRETGIPLAFGVRIGHEGVSATGPGSFFLHFQARCDSSEKRFLQDVQDWTIRLSFGVAGSIRTAKVEGLLSRSKRSPRKAQVEAELGRWTLQGGVDEEYDGNPLVVPFFTGLNASGASSQAR
ncbi:MAG: hypothetical protein JWM49_2125 [Microbacteriaceae bacterium]|nr:hypothetical protein [Microbacteriaceae bacterium]